jgi:diguanylate cyclase (GGDEF)-like protein/PAS domain S-box-containing protein
MDATADESGGGERNRLLGLPGGLPTYLGPQADHVARVGVNLITQALFEHSTEVVLIGDAAGIIRYVSPSAERITGYRPEDLVGSWVRDYVHPDDLIHMFEAFEHGFNAPGDHVVVEIRIRFADGTWHWVEETITDLREHPQIGGMVLNCRDISAERSSREALVASEERYRTIVETAESGIWLMDLEGIIEFVNPKMASVLGYPSADSLVGRSIFDLLIGDDAVHALHDLAVLKSGRSVHYERRLRCKDGTLVWTRIAGSPLRAADGSVTGTLAVVSDLTASRDAEAKLLDQARRDPLTGLPNRSGAANALRQLLDSPRHDEQSLAMFLINLDRFSEINSSLGHDAGDEVLIEFGRRLEGVSRSVDVVAHLGADEFAVMARNIKSEAEAEAVGRRILGTVDEPFRAGNMRVAVGTSIGIAYPPPPAADVKIMFQRADTALHHAKALGGGRWEFYDLDEDENNPDRLALIVDLRRALATDELMLHYQPKMDLVTGRVVGVEALARWTHPVLGPVPPSEFIPLAERYGLAIPMAGWALHTALSQCSAWWNEGIELPVAVNFSSTSLRDDSLYSTITEALRRTGVPADRLTIEITEGSVVEPSPNLLDSLSGLRALGVKVSIDDFGTGYSALAYLKDLPIDEIKIDRAFTSRILDDLRDLQIVKAIVTLGRSLGLTVVAEGIETRETQSLLAREECIGQGYVICRPAAASDITQWYRNHQATIPSTPPVPTVPSLPPAPWPLPPGSLRRSGS